MKTKSYNVYTFAELSPAAQSRAIDYHRKFVAETWDADAAIDDAQQMLAFAGFTVDRVHYSGFSSQGDGACFTGSWRASDVDAKGMRENAPEDTRLHAIADGMARMAALYPDARFAVKHSGHYSHEYCTVFDFTLSDTREVAGAEADDTEKELTELARDAMRWIYRQIEAEYEFATSDEQVRESIEANDYEFTQDGAIAPRDL